jgi:hypothetical protein
MQTIQSLLKIDALSARHIEIVPRRKISQYGLE